MYCFLSLHDADVVSPAVIVTGEVLTAVADLVVPTDVARKQYVAIVKQICC